MSVKYKAVAFEKDLGTFDSLAEAFVPLYKLIQDKIDDKSLVWDDVENGVCIERTHSSGAKYRIMKFNAVRNYMIAIGYLTDGYLHEEYIK